MRKLDVLRNELRKCHNYSDVEAIKLPQEFRWWFDDKGHRPYIEHIYKLNDGRIELAIRHEFDEEDEDGYTHGSVGYETYVLHPRKGFVYGWNS